MCWSVCGGIVLTVLPVECPHPLDPLAILNHVCIAGVKSYNALSLANQDGHAKSERSAPVLVWRRSEPRVSWSSQF